MTFPTLAEVPYRALAQSDKAVYRQGESVLINGQAVSVASGEIMAHVPVKIGLSVKGFDRFFSVDTDSNGNFSTTFTPAASEAGTYSLWAVHPDLSDRSVQASFDIVGLAVTPDIYNLSLARGQSFDIPVSLKNLGNAEIAGLTFATAAAERITAVVINGGDDKLSAGENQAITLRVSAAVDAPPSGYATLSIGTAAGLSDRVEVNINMVTLIPLIRTSPSFIDTGMMRGNQKIESFTLSNTGRAVLKNVRLDGPSTSWMSLTVESNLGDVAIGQSVSIGIMLRPDAALPPGVYNDRIVVNADNHIPYTFNIQVTVTSDAVGSIYFDVQNELYEKLAGASITLQHQTLLDLRYTLKTGADGTILLNDISEGRYSYNVSAPGCVPYSGSFIIEPGRTTTLPLALEVNMVDIQWSVTPTTIQDKYEIKISQTFETNVPTPVLIAEPAGITLPDMQPGEIFNGEFTITNYGLIAVFDVEISFPTSFEDYDIEVLTEAIPERIEAMQKIVVPYRVTRRVNATTAATSLFDEVRGFGGSSCFVTAYIGVKGKCTICPNSPTERIVEKIVNYILSGRKYIGCPESTSSSSTPAIVIGNYSVSGGGNQVNGGIFPTQENAIKTDNPCDCKSEGECCVDSQHTCISNTCTPVTLTNVDATANGKTTEIKEFSKNTPISFTSSPTGDCEYVYSWDFGDGSTSTEASPSHVYNSHGIYNVINKVHCKKCSPPEITKGLNVTLVKVQSLTGGGKTSTDDNPDETKTILVKKGSTLTFTATKDPSGAPWPDGKPVWGGSSGASGSGDSVTVTFDTNSASKTDYKTVEVECGNRVKLNVLVYEYIIGIHSSFI